MCILLPPSQKKTSYTTNKSLLSRVKASLTWTHSILRYHQAFLLSFHIIGMPEQNAASLWTLQFSSLWKLLPQYTLSVGLRICWLYLLEKGKTPPLKKKRGYSEYDTKLHLRKRLQFSRTGECGVSLHYHSS